ncbi:MAG: VWA domain-containing protein [Lachnospiraceae bacterium]|nr:VWA domain-containing protein [Lachnospiraceae bacterium]
MKKKATEMVCILDRSGSMYKKRKDTIGSFNQMLEKQKREPGEAYITTALFSDQCDVLYSHTPIRETEELAEQDYYIGGNTALFDAIGKVFHQTDSLLEGREGDYEEKVLVFIITDGMENASVQYSRQQIKKLIEEKQKKGWVILFFGTDMEMIKLAEDTGIRKENTTCYPDTAEGIRESFLMAGSCFSSLRRS